MDMIADQVDVPHPDLANGGRANTRVTSRQIRQVP